MKAFKKKGSEDDINKIQDNIGLAIGPILNSPIVNGVLISNVSLTSSLSNTIEHGLGREPLGYIVVKKSANSNIWDSQASNKLKRLTLILNCSANCVVDLWVF